MANSIATNDGRGLSKTKAQYESTWVSKFQNPSDFGFARNWRNPKTCADTL